MRSLIIACIALGPVDGTGKVFDLCWKEEKSHSLKNEERKEKKKILYAKQVDSGFVLWYKEKNSATNLSLVTI